MQFNLDSRVVRSSEPICTELDGTAVLLSVEQSGYFGLNDVGTAIWNETAEPITLTQLRDRITARFDVQPADCERDLLRFVETLCERGFLLIDG